MGYHHQRITTQRRVGENLVKIRPAVAEQSRQKKNNNKSKNTERVRPVYSDNSTQLDVELSTRSQREQLSPISSERRDPVRLSSDATQLDVELSGVELCRYKRAFRKFRRRRSLRVSVSCRNLKRLVCL